MLEDPFRLGDLLDFEWARQETEQKIKQMRLEAEGKDNLQTGELLTKIMTVEQEIERRRNERPTLEAAFLLQSLDDSGIIEADYV